MANKTAKVAGVTGQDAWERFIGDRKLLKSHSVTQEELEFLSSVSLFGKLQSVDDVFFILKNIRAASKGMKEARKSSK